MNKQMKLNLKGIRRRIMKIFSNKLLVQKVNKKMKYKNK